MSIIVPYESHDVFLTRLSKLRKFHTTRLSFCNKTIIVINKLCSKFLRTIYYRYNLYTYR